MLTQREQAGEQQRFIQVVKMRGTEHSRDEHSFVIRESGIEVYAPRVTIQREDIGINQPRLKTGIHKFDDLLGEGISRGSSLLIAGVSGTGKTILLLEFLYRGALAGEKGILFSFEETEERRRSNARSLGWGLDEQIERGMVEIIFIPQPNILVEAHLMMRERIGAMQARRVAVDSVSVFLHKVKDAQLAREKVFQLASIIQNTQAVGFLATDIRYGATEISRFGVEETVVDGVFVLSSTEEGLERHRYIEIYKLRNTAHLIAAGDGARPGTNRARIRLASPRLRILVADDNADAATTLAMLLQMMGHDTHVAHDGAKALELAAALRPHAAVLDIGMPGLSGYEVARRIRTEPWGHEMTLVALTGWGQREHRERTKAAGFDGHLVKPVAVSDLEGILTRLRA